MLFSGWERCVQVILNTLRHFGSWRVFLVDITYVSLLMVDTCIKMQIVNYYAYCIYVQ